MLKRFAAFILLMLATAAVVVAQTGNPDAEITFPPPVYVLGGEAEIIGTANVTGQVGYFIEYRPLDDLFEPIVDDTWFPATLPTRQPVTDGILGVWDTTVAPDGIYELRLIITTANGVVTDSVMPVRVDNSEGTVADGGTLDADDSINNALLALTATSQAFVNPNAEVTPIPIQPGSTLEPTVTLPSIGNAEMTAEVLVISNLRGGDSTLHNIEDGLQPGTELEVLGRSSRGTRWLYVVTPSGEEGWVAPSVVRLSGNLLDLPEIEPPPPPVTPTPIPSPTPISPDANVISVRVDRDLKEDEPFQIIVTVRNDGGEFLPSSQIFCNVEPMNTNVTFSGGNLQPGATGEFVIPLRVDSGGGQNVNIICVFDPNQFVADGNRNNNINRVTRFMEDD